MSKLKLSAQPFVPTIRGKEVVVDPAKTGNKVPGANPTASVVVNINMAAVFSACASFCQIALVKGYPPANIPAALVALQTDLLASMANQTSLVYQATQLWWDLKDAVSPVTVQTVKGNFSFAWNTTNVVPLTSPANSTWNGYTVGTTVVDGLVTLNPNPVSNPETTQVLNEFFSFIATSNTPLKTLQDKFTRFKDDPSAFAQKVNRINNGTNHLIDNLPMHSVVCLEVPIRSYWGQLGFASGSDSRFTKFVRQCEGGAAAVIVTENFLREKNGDTVKWNGRRPSWINYWYKFVDLDAVLWGLFSLLDHANALQLSANQEIIFTTSFDAVALILYVINAVVNMRGYENGAAIGLEFNGAPLIIGTPTTGIANALNNQLPAWIVESVRSLALTVYGTDYVYPVVTISPNIIQVLSSVFPNYNWDNWGGSGLNPLTATLNGQVVSLVPTTYDNLSIAFSQISELFSQASNILITYQAVQTNAFSLMGFTRPYYSPNGSEAIKKQRLKYLVARNNIKQNAIEGAIDTLQSSGIKALTDTVETTFSCVGFPNSYFLNQNLILPMLFSNTFDNDTMNYAYGNNYSYVSSQGSSNSPSSVAAMTSQTLTRAPNNPVSNETVEGLLRRIGKGGAFSSILGNKVGGLADGLVNELGPVASAINWGLGTGIDFIKKL